MESVVLHSGVAVPLGQLAAIEIVIELAHDYSLETRIRRLITDHQAGGDQARTLVMNIATWRMLVDEMSGEWFSKGHFWTPQAEGSTPDPENFISSFRGLPILIKDFVADQEVIVGV